jgi:hypothetical protein
MMKKLLTGTLAALALAAGPAFAETPSAAAPAAGAGVEAKSKTPDTTAEARFKAADKNLSGALEGAEVDGYKANMASIDTNKDGKVSRDEFTAAVKAGHIK